MASSLRGIDEAIDFFLAEGGDQTALGFITTLERDLLAYQPALRRRFPALRHRSQSSQAAMLATQAVPLPNLLTGTSRPHRCLAPSP